MNKTVPYILIALFFAILGYKATEMNTQYVRLFDVLLYGPYLTYLAFQNEYVFSTLEKLFLLYIGTTTITYNLKKFYSCKKDAERC
jgi:hypothetical protein